MRWRLWHLLQCCVLAPLDGALTLLLGRCPKWLDRLFDRCADREWACRPREPLPPAKVALLDMTREDGRGA